MKGGAQGAGRGLFGSAVAWLAGNALQLQERSLSPPWAYPACLAFGVVLLVAVGSRRRMFDGTWLPVVLLAAAAFGFGCAGTRASLLMADTLRPTLEGVTVEAVGTIASLPQRGPDGVRFRFDVESATLAGRPVRLPATLSLGWYQQQNGPRNKSAGKPPGRARSESIEAGSIDNPDDPALVTPRQDLRAGQRWRFELRLKQPHGNLNPNGFDYELNLFEQGVRATGYVRDARPVLLDRAAAHPVERARQHVRDAIDAAVPDRRAAGVISALAVGDQSAIMVYDIKVVSRSFI